MPPRASQPESIPEQHAKASHTKVGIPPLKAPTLPTGRAAALIACTKTCRAYWIVFKRSPGSHAGWEWERNLRAVPLPNARNTYEQIPFTNEITPTHEDLDMGGKDWGSWSCPGCGQRQIRRGRHQVHLTPCLCGMYCCLGPGVEEDHHPNCPNCGRTVQETSRIETTLHNAHHGLNGLPDGRAVSAPTRRALEK